MVSRRKFLKRAFYTTAGVAGLGYYSFIHEPAHRLVERNWPLTLEDWPEEALPLRIVALSDFHVTNRWMPTDRVAEIAKVAMSLNPGLIVLLGDYLRGLPDFWVEGAPTIPEWTKALSGLKAPLGVYAILGNHDSKKDALRAGFGNIGVPVLSNNVVRLERGGKHFWLAGLPSQMIGKPDLAGTLSQTDPNEPVILLAHEPDIFPEVVHTKRKVSLTLSGHTHGGQVGVPFLGSVAELMGRKYVHGHYSENDRNLIVSGGLGVTRVPVRFMVPPEITVIDLLRPAPKPEA
ncbi:MAG: metallophosphoesterase [Alphaproteobacteria bacterium]